MLVASGPGPEDRVQDQTTPPLDFSSVVTQVTTRESIAPRHPVLLHPNGQLDCPVQRSWSSRLVSILCCFAPESGGYFKADGERVAVRTPPRRSQKLLGPKHSLDLHKKTLVLDLDETLVHSSFKPVPNPDYVIPVDIDGKVVDVYVLKRPWLDHFMETVGKKYEVVVFTASLAKYADPLLDIMDRTNVVRWRLFRESCCPYEGNYVKDMSCLGRDLAQTIIVDNSPHSYVFQPQNALPIGTFIDNMEDRELLDLLQFLEKVENVDDVRHHLKTLSHEFLPQESYGI